MRSWSFLRLALLGASIAAVLEGTAAGQCRLCESPSTSRDDPAQNGDVRIEIQSALNFDRLIMYGAGQGGAVIRPDGSTLAEGSVTQIGPRAMVGTAIVHGEAGRSVRVDLPRRIDLYSLSGGRISVEEVESDLPSVPRLDSAGNLTFRFGGRVRISGDADGEYRGDLPITVEYQ